MAENEALCNFEKFIDQTLETAAEGEIILDECRTLFFDKFVIKKIFS